MQLCDFDRSYVFTSSARDGQQRNHCRTQILASCELIHQETGESGKFYLGKECIGEHMYMEGGIAQIPTSQVWGIFSENITWQDKKFASHERDLIQVAEVGEDIPMFSGLVSQLTECRFHLKRAQARLLRTPQEISEATFNAEPLIGRTQLQDDAGTWRSVLEYAIPYMNVPPSRSRFQIDVGPVLAPDFNSRASQLISRVQICYILFNQFEEAEFALLAPDSIGDPPTTQTLHFSQVITRGVSNQIYSLGVGE